MKLVTVKKASEATSLAGQPIEYITENGNLMEVRIGRLVIKKASDYGSAIAVMKEQPFAEADRHRVRGIVAGISIEEFFEDYEIALARQNELNRATASDVEFSLDEIKALIDDDGNVVGKVDGQ